MKQRWWMLGIAAGLVLVPASAAGAGGGDHAAAGGGGGALCSGFASGATVVMRDNCFEGTAHFVDPGEITVTNEGEQPHNLTLVDESSATSDLSSGVSETLAIADAGIYRVYCTIHGSASGGGMAGVLIVGDPTTLIAATAPAAPAAPAGGVDPGASDEGSEWLVISVAVGIPVVLTAALWLWARGIQRRQAGGAAEVA